jgi:hypothetical protein
MMIGVTSMTALKKEDQDKNTQDNAAAQEYGADSM